jgi:hypothetical protein
MSFSTTHWITITPQQALNNSLDGLPINGTTVWFSCPIRVEPALDGLPINGTTVLFCFSDKDTRLPFAVSSNTQQARPSVGHRSGRITTMLCPDNQDLNDFTDFMNQDFIDFAIQDTITAGRLWCHSDWMGYIFKRYTQF